MYKNDIRSCSKADIFGNITVWKSFSKFIPELKTLFGLVLIWAFRLPPFFPVTRIGTTWVTSILAGGRKTGMMFNRQKVSAAYGLVITHNKHLKQLTQMNNLGFLTCTMGSFMRML